MKIRSITAFIDAGPKPDEWELASLAKAIDDAKAALETEGYEVQTTRLATTPFPKVIQPLEEEEALTFAKSAEKRTLMHDFGYLALGPAMVEYPESYALIPAMLANSEISFFSGMLTSGANAISGLGVRESAEVMRKAARIESNGFANLRFAALANVGAGSPFFPAAYHAGGKAQFAIATQAADLAVDAFERAKSVREGGEALSAAIEMHGQRMAKIAESVSAESGIGFGGIDFSLAPFPEERESLGTAFERMGVAAVGMQGSLTAAAVLTSVIEAANYPRVGFNGLLLPPLEDATLATRAAEGVLSVNDLLMYSAVCGTGLDTIPLPGDSSREQLSAILMDVAALALRLNKPLTTRLMPIPGKMAGEKTEFDFDFFANSRVMAIDNEVPGGAFEGNEDIPIRRRKS
jgi:uncharacterized protein (UPF0210 family)